MTFSKNATDQLRSVMRNAVAGPDGIPGATVVVVNRDGSELFAHSVGKRGGSIDEDMTLEHVYWIASCTKLLTAIACLQQVERGVLKLDASDQLEDLCPELKSLMVLGRNGDLEPKRKGITLRMLLTHTAGFGYSIFNEELRDWSLPMGIDEFACDFSELDVPLLFQPGEGWEYGVSSRPLGHIDVGLRLTFIGKHGLGGCCIGESHGKQAQRLHPGQHMRTSGLGKHEHVPDLEDEGGACVYASTLA